MRQAAQQQLDIDGLRAQITQQLRSNAAFSQTVYHDQPILMTGRQLRTYVPDAIRSARQLARHPKLRYASEAKLFYEQARALAGYSDDYEYTGTFKHYYPTYESMNNEELRGYFTWRTKVRNGHVERGSLSFAFLYLYELINLIGVASAQEGYEAIRAFGHAYAQLDSGIRRYVDEWLDDFVIYYQLSPSLLRSMSFAKHDAAYELLAHREEHSDTELFQAICSLSSYDILSSPFFPEHEDELRALVAQTYRLVASHHDAKLKTSLIDKLFGRMSFEAYRPFGRAIFADPLAVRQATYAISPVDTVYCKEGIWHRARYASLEAPCPWLSKLLESAESILRDAYEFPNTLGQPLTTKYIVKNLSSQAAELVAQRRAAEERAVHIDMSKLEHIRSAADATCEKLIVEEEEPERLVPAVRANECTTGARSAPLPGINSNKPATVRPDETPEPDARTDRHMAAIARPDETPEPDGNTGISEQCGRGALRAPAVRANERPASTQTAPTSPLTPLERELVLAILAGSPTRDFEHEHACMASVLIDSINEKLYDEFADICIDASAGQPEIIEDYIEDLEELLAA